MECERKERKFLASSTEKAEMPSTEGEKAEG